MANLIIPGGVTLSGSFEAGLNTGGAGGPNFGTARSLGIYTQLGSAAWSGNSADWATDSYSYSVSGGIMTLTFSLTLKPEVLPNVNSTTVGAGVYTIGLPMGYAFAPSVTESVGANDYGNTTLGTNLGSGVYTEASGNYPTTLHPVSGKIAMKFDTYFDRNWSYMHGAITSCRGITFTATIPVVAV